MIRNYDTVTSTMSLAREQAELGAPHGTLVCAREQTAGRGRRGRTWTSGRDRGIYLTVVWRPIPPLFASGLTVAVGVAVSEAIEATFGPEFKIAVKWPNDLWLNQQKVGGILVEATRPNEQGGFLLVGVGINLKPQALPPSALARAFVAPTSLFSGNEPKDLSDCASSPTEAQKKIALLLGNLERHLATAYDTFFASGLTPFLTRFETRDALTGRAIRTVQDDCEMTGVAFGIDADGRLLLAAEGQTLKLHAGEVTCVREPSRKPI